VILEVHSDFRVSQKKYQVCKIETMNLHNIFLILFGVLTITNETFTQTNTETSSVVSENSQLLQKRPRSDEQRPSRPRRPQNSGFSGLLSGKYNVINLYFVVL
jgi:hypothetical protein